MFNITAGNDISFRISLYRGGDAFPVELSHDVVVNVVSSKTRRAVPFSIGEGVVYVDVSHEGLGTGIYGIEVRGVLNGGTWRSYYDSVWQYTLATRAGEGYSDSEGDVYDITMDVQFYTSGNVDAKIEAHNQSEEAHPYIRGLITQKQDVIPDLATIRSGAEKGATAYQKPANGIPYSDLSEDVNADLDYGNTSFWDLHDEDTGLLWKVPAQASKTNKLADKDFVNSSISTATATFKGTYNSVAELEQVTADANDYAFVISTDSAGNTVYNRYKYSNGSWLFEYALNNSSFTAAQWAAINSAITSGDVEKLAALPTKVQLDALFAAKQDTLTFDNLPTQNSNNPVKSGGVFTALGSKAEKVVVEYFEFPEDPVGAATLKTNTIVEVEYVNVMRFVLGDPISDIKNEYCIKFDVGVSIPTLTLPNEIIWAEEIELEANTHYVILISYENDSYYGDWKSYPLT